MAGNLEKRVYRDERTGQKRRWMTYRMAQKLLQLRPFAASNGLVARLLLEGMCARAGLPAPLWHREDRNSYLSALVAGDRGDRGRLISGFWKMYRQQHYAGVWGELEVLPAEPRQAHLEAF